MTFHGKHWFHAIIGEDVGVPAAFLEATSIDGANAAIYRIDRDLVGCQTNDWAESCVSFVDCDGVILLLTVE